MIFWGLIFAFNFPGVIDIWVIKDEVASNLTFLIGQNILDNNENICREAFIDCYSAKLVNAQLSSSFKFLLTRVVKIIFSFLWKLQFPPVL